MPVLETRIKLVRGASRIVRLYLQDERSQPEDLGDFESARLEVAQEEGGVPVLTVDSTVIGSDADGTYVEFTVEEEDATLPAATYIADARVVINGDSYQTKKLYVEISEGITR